MEKLSSITRLTNKQISLTSGAVNVSDSEKEKMLKIARARLIHRKNVLESRGFTVK